MVDNRRASELYLASALVKSRPLAKYFAKLPGGQLREALSSQVVNIAGYLPGGLPNGRPLDKYAANEWLDPDPHRKGIQTKQYGAHLQ